MNQLPKVLIVVAMISLATALIIKFTTLRNIIPGPLPLNWARLADTFLLLSIAISVINRK